MTKLILTFHNFANAPKLCCPLNRKRTHFFVTEINGSKILWGKKIIVYSENHRKNTHTIYGQNKVIFSVVGTTLKSHCDFQSLTL
jgi:hypothetical protein